VFERELGADDFHVAMTLDHVAEAYAAQGRYAEAEHFYGRVVAILAPRLGSDHALVQEVLAKQARARLNLELNGAKKAKGGTYDSWKRSDRPRVCRSVPAQLAGKRLMRRDRATSRPANKEAAAATASTGAPSGDGTTIPMINGRTSAEQPAMSGAPAGHAKRGVAAGFCGVSG